MTKRTRKKERKKEKKKKRKKEGNDINDRNDRNDRKCLIGKRLHTERERERWKKEIKRDDILFLCLCLCLCLFLISFPSFSSFLHHFLRHSVDIVASLYRCAICNLLLCQMPFPHSSQKIITSISHRCRHVKYTYIYI